MTNLLDLRKRVEPQVKIIYRTVTTRRPWYVEILKITAVIAIVTAIVWGVSRADIETPKPVIKNFSVSGIISEISTSTISLSNAKGSDDSSKTSYTLDVSNVKKFETKTYFKISLADLVIGDKVVAQGIIKDGVTEIRRIISFTSPDVTKGEEAEVKPEIATSTATTTESISTTTATTTEQTTGAETSTTTDITPTRSADTSTSTEETNPTETAATTTTENSTTTASTTEQTTSTTTEEVVQTSPAPTGTPSSTESMPPQENPAPQPTFETPASISEPTEPQPAPSEPEPAPVVETTN